MQLMWCLLAVICFSLVLTSITNGENSFSSEQYTENKNEKSLNDELLDVTDDRSSSSDLNDALAENKPLQVNKRQGKGWPKGTYALPMPMTGCPLQWQWGGRVQHSRNNNSWSKPDLLAGMRDKSYMSWEFCTKTVSEGDGDWPEGYYCILKKGQCPPGFQEGMLKWDDKNRNNRNERYGVLPDGVYNKDTKMYFCCRGDAFFQTIISLPTDVPFVLMKTNNVQCQTVEGMSHQEQRLTWANENKSNSDERTGSTPYDSGRKYPSAHVLELHFCIYTKK